MFGLLQDIKKIYRQVIQALYGCQAKMQVSMQFQKFVQIQIIVTKEPAITEKYWITGSDEANKTKEMHQEELRVTLNYKIRLLNNPILKEEIKGIPELKNMLILRNAIEQNLLYKHMNGKLFQN